MGINFPASPTVGQKYPQPAVAGIPVYTWDGEKWTTVGGSIAAYAPPSTILPLMDATPAVTGVGTAYAREDHVHPLSTSTDFVKTVPQTLTAPQQQQARQNIGSPAANLIINGDFRVNQVAYVSAAALAAGVYGHDQWKAGASGGDYSFTQLKSSTQITIASGKSLIQPIEDVNVTGGSYVLSWTGTAQARAGINTLTPSGTYAASPLLIPGQTAGTAMSVEFNNGTLGPVKLESGANATPFIMRPYDQELMTCQRYYEKLATGSGTDRIVGSYASGGSGYVIWHFNVRKRAMPTASIVGIIGTVDVASPDYISVTAGAGYSIIGSGSSADARL